MTERERRAFNRGVEAAAKIADLWADESILMADDTVKLDPMINDSLRKQLASVEAVEEACMTSARLADEGAQYAIQHHCSKDIAKMIRQQKLAKVKR